MTDHLEKHWKNMFDQDYIGVYALETDTIVRIKNIQVEEVTGDGGRKDTLPVAHFYGDIKPLILNKTNCKTLSKLTGSEKPKDWAGHHITLYPDPSVKFGKETTGGVRIRPVAPKLAKQALTPESEKWAGAIKALREKATSLEKIKKNYDLSPEHEALLLQQVAAVDEAPAQPTEEVS